MITVELLSYTPDALNLLLTTKGTRLGSSDDDPRNWSEERKLDHLAYMRKTIRSSWEFVDYVFRISGVTRAFTHQLVRSRHNSFAQESMRVVDASDHPVTTPPLVEEHEQALSVWDDVIESIRSGYRELTDLGIPLQDARGLLPTNVQTSIIMKANLRSLSESGLLRLCTRTRGEYQEAFRAMVERVTEVHPWAAQFINVYCVEHGHCAFPAYGAKECPVYLNSPVEMEAVLDERRKSIHKVWALTRYEAAPKAAGGKAQ